MYIEAQTSVISQKIEMAQNTVVSGTSQGDIYKNIMSSVEIFKSAVVRIRDILRGPGVSITGMDSMRHICLYLLSRYITRDNVESLGVPADFAWENLIETAQTKNGGLQFALDSFYNTEEDCLVRHFDRLFGTEKFSFDIKSPHKHKEILEILNNVNMAEVDCQIDILGWVYEQHLATGSSSASRDLGQYFTDRSICKYMVKLCKPSFKNPGVPESVCDPSMGTGGFLTAYIKYFKEYHADTPVDWSVQEKEMHGCDTDPKVAGVARMNVFMETSGSTPSNMLTHDSLYGDLTQTGYDVILANEPFGLKGIKHADCCERVKDLKIRGTKSEPLFLQLMMVSLNMGGRCAVVVPDGMLVNSSTLHNGTRKYLLDNFELKRIIKMKGKFFMNTGIQPSVMFFQRTGKPTTSVEFWEVVKTDKGEIEETMVVSVPREKFDDTCSFDMRRYMEDDKPVANPAGYPMVKLGDIAEIESGVYITKKDASNQGFPIYGGGDACNYYSNTSNRNNRMVVAKDGVSLKCVRWIEGDFYLNHHGWTMKCGQNVLEKFLFYTLSMKQLQIYNLAKGSAQKGINQETMKNFEIPLPPLHIQEEIVATLDRIYSPGTTELADTLKMTDKAMDLVLAQPDGTTLEPIVEAQRLIRKSAQMVADVKAQMVAIMKSIERRGFDVVKLVEKCDMRIGGTPLRSKNEYYEGGEYVWVSVSELNNSVIYDSKEHINELGVKHSNVKLVKKGSVLMSFKLSIGKCAIAGVDLYTNEAVVAFNTNDESELLNKYLHYYLQSFDFSNSGKGSIGVGSMNKSSLSELTIPLPPFDFQQSVITRLDALQSQLDALQSLQKQSEDNARFILESYLTQPDTQATDA